MGTHLAPNGSSSAINMALASPNKALKSTWKVLDQNLESDHFVIQIVINEHAFREEIRLPSINMKEVNWNSFQLRCLRTLHQELPSEDLEENTNYVTASILQAAILSSPAQKYIWKDLLLPFGTKIADWQLRKETGKGTSSGGTEPRNPSKTTRGRRTCLMGSQEGQEGMLAKFLLQAQQEY